MRLGIVADVHVGNHRKLGGPVLGGMNQRCRETLDVLSATADRAVSEQCDVLVVAGDLFDTARPEPQVVAAVQRALDRNPNMATMVLRGNHDMVSEREGDHALGPLDPVCYVHEVPARVTVGDGEVWLVPFQPGVATEWLPRALSELAEVQERGKRSPSPASRVLVLHLGLSDEDTAPWLHDAHDAVPVGLVQALCRKHKVGACFAGNWHDHKTWGDDDSLDPLVCQVGALVPTGFDNPGVEPYGTLAIWDSGEGFQRVVMPGPRFVKDPGHMAVINAAREGDKLYVQLTARTVADRAQCEARASELKTDESLGAGCVAQVEVVQDDAEAELSARSAAAAARSSETMTEALDSFVREMELADGVDRKEVLERSKKYLGV